MHGYGIYYNAVEKKRYEGEWRRGNKQGNFKVFDRCGGELEVYFSEDDIDGKGSYRIPEKLEVSCTWKNGVKHGRLTAEFTSAKAKM